MFKKCKILQQQVVEKEKKITMDKYFAPRTTQGAQPYIKSVLVGKEDVWKVDIFVERFLL